MDDQVHSPEQQHQTSLLLYSPGCPAGPLGHVLGQCVLPLSPHPSTPVNGEKVCLRAWRPQCFRSQDSNLLRARLRSPDDRRGDR